MFNVSIRKMTPIFHIPEVPAWDHDPKSDYPEIFWGFFSTPAQIKPHPLSFLSFQAIISLSNHNSMSYILRHW